MNQLSKKTSFLLFHFIFFINVKAQNTSENEEKMPSQDSITNFQPSLAVVIGILSIMFSVTFILLLYAKFCHRPSSFNNMIIHQSRSRSRASGIDKTLIESLPFFRFSLLKGSREGLECAVCLSKFNDIEILRLLPKCKHAFHIDCIDQWLEKHSSCPLCRQKVGINDLSQMAYSNSFRFLWNQTELREESNLELFVQRKENHYGSSRFSIGSSFRKSEKGKNVEEESIDFEENKKSLHRFNHKIVVSDVVLKNRWSNVSSSDIMFLNSEMINDVSSSRFSCLDSRNEQKSLQIKGVEESDHMTNIKEEMERKRSFESKIKLNDHRFAFPGLSTTSDFKQNPRFESKVLNPNNKRSMSEIILLPRFTELRTTDSSVAENNVKEERTRKLWLPIARKTVRWFANRETRPPKSHGTRPTLNL